MEFEEVARDGRQHAAVNAHERIGAAVRPAQFATVLDEVQPAFLECAVGLAATLACPASGAEHVDGRGSYSHTPSSRPAASNAGLFSPN